MAKIRLLRQQASKMRRNHGCVDGGAVAVKWMSQRRNGPSKQMTKVPNAA